MKFNDAFELGAADLRRIDEIVQQHTGLDCLVEHMQWRRRQRRAWLLASAAVALLSVLACGLYLSLG